MKKKKIIVVGSGNAALCASIAALEKGAEVLILEKGNEYEAGGNSKYTAGAMRFVYYSKEDLLPLLLNPNDEKLPNTEFGTYTEAKFKQDLLEFNDGKPLSMQQKILISQSYDTMKWLVSHNIKFEPIYSRQCYEKDGKYMFWGGLTLACNGEGVGLIEKELEEFLRLGGKIKYEVEAIELISVKNQIKGVITAEGEYLADAVVLGCGGFEANPELREKFMGPQWAKSKVRGTQHNMGKGIEMAMNIGAAFHGLPEGCHATPMDYNMPNYGNLDIPHLDRKNYRKICYFLGIMVNDNGERFVDEGSNFRNYTYAQFGRAILNQPSNRAWQIFDNKVSDLLYKEYSFWDASFIEAQSIEELVGKMDNVNKSTLLKTIHDYNESVDVHQSFDPTSLDGKSTRGLSLNKSNWATKLDSPPYRAYPVTCGITFTYGGLKVDDKARVLNEEDEKIDGLYACGELVGGVFYNGYPGGSGLTSGAVFGRLAGYSAAMFSKNFEG